MKLLEESLSWETSKDFGTNWRDTQG